MRDTQVERAGIKHIKQQRIEKYIEDQMVEINAGRRFVLHRPDVPPDPEELQAALVRDRSIDRVISGDFGELTYIHTKGKKI